jgi:hypothetical protein
MADSKTTKSNLSQLPAKLYELLAAFTPEERQVIIRATLILFGDEQINSGTPAPPSYGTPAQSLKSESKYFDEKAPKNKGEELAVAARYRELNEQAESHAKDDLKQIITGARRNFDNKNFVRDIKNAKLQAGFFNSGDDKGSYTLSYFGQQFVDALPDREATRKLKRPKKKGKRKGSGTKSSA